MNERIRTLLSMMLVVAIALLLAFPFVPASASDAGASREKKASTSEAVVIAEGAEAEEEAIADEETIAEEEATALEEKAAVEEQAIVEEKAAQEQSEAMVMVQQDPWEVTSLDISKDVDLVTASGPEISLEKTASESYIEMKAGETKQVNFTIEVDAELSNSYNIEGNIFVQNTGEWAADVIAVSDTVWYKAGGPAWLAATSNITTTVPMGDNAIPTGGPHVYSYSGTFTLPVPLASVTSMSNLIEITISNKPDPPKPGMQDWKFHYRQDFAKPAGGGSTEVMLEDIETIDPATGLSYEITSTTINGADAGSLTGPWMLDLAEAPFTIVIEKDLTAEEAGVYILNNKAKIGDLEDDVDVEIVVTDPRGRITGEKIDFITQEPVAGVKFVLEGEGFYAEAFSDENGLFDFGWITPGEYHLYEVVPEGWVSVTGTEHDIVLEDGDAEHYVFMNKRLSSIYGYKWLDANADGIRQDGESALAGVTIVLEGMGVSEERVTDANGYFVFEALLDGQYMVMEEVPEGYYATSAAQIGVMLGAGEEKRVDFLNAQYASVLGTKWLDLNANGAFDEGEAGLAGVAINLRDAEGDIIATTVSGADGSYAFTGLKAGDYTVEEIVGDGYVATAPVSVSFSLSAGEEKVVDFFNNVQVAGEVVVPPAQIESGQTLPVTGFEVSYLLLMIGLLILTGAFIASYGLLRMARTR
ncbi:MAG: SdrD B-like domain-containing protein [Actinomycetota bacterium]|nr:SdrD B-like domain-containing protein [Actinomycetota bacterium]MDD5667977.1 SdrD B-like domain-containing protein [Actinomycetota bacterium]